MSLTQSKTRAFGSPSRYIQGRYEINSLKEYTDAYGDKVFIIVDTFFYKDYCKKFEEMYKGNAKVYEYKGEITAERIDEIADTVKDFSPNVVVGMGGGKTMDTAKAVADKYKAATIIIPTTASTDAPAIGLSVLYNDKGEHIGARHYVKNPDLVLLDTDIIAKAPIRFFVAGMGDGLATYIEARANFTSCSPNYVGKGFRPTVAVKALAEACHQTILEKGISAMLATKEGLCTIDVEDVIEANTLLSGLGVQNSSCAGAHSVAEGITILPECAKLLHGEVVAFGVLVQLIIEGRPAEEIEEMYSFFDAVGLPSTFAMLGIPNASDADIMKVAEESLKSYWDTEPFPVDAQMIYDAIKMADILGKQYK
ncbi:glycerol dehydrogenase [Candidatus Epulonipiscium fishelsonii]|uniref:Glycerol dehydrogenase n=1 Tax=Candidatus Epulonipiscium fishelsonii TaxID=77094 RepID=A0ACC8XH41_9FIRM|nr:glycerol dehydrogenase [Epulopiscium sp. SCG-B05WGA-EpuloA1]ONI42986.1 glycerol dehydrogenase [Epulopiscium sp. SCG-B11WGA-EpuloA1]